jgi:sugar/nucleoside kinase (ribokinase family)
MHMRAFAQEIGGNACVATVALARLGATTAFTGHVGDDAYGHIVRDGLRADGVDVALLSPAPGDSTALTVIISDLATGTRSIVNHPVIATASITITEDIVRVAQTARYVHLDYLAFTAAVPELIPRCRTVGTLVSVDAGVEIPDVVTYLPLIDVYATTDEQLFAMTGERDLGRALRWVRRAGPRVVVATMGAEGSAGLDEDGELVVAPAFRVDVADTTGAGDVYHGGMLYALLQGQPLRDALFFANATAALSCRTLGGRPGCPTLAEVQALLARGQISHE